MVDTTAPILLLTLPADNATGVSVTSTLRLGFSEAVNATSGLIKIYKSDGTLFHTIAANDTSQVSFDSTKARVTIDPSVTLLAGTSYYVIVESGAFEDLAGNDYAGLSSPTVFNFTTAGTGGGGGSAPADTTAPVLTATSPVDNAAGVAPTTNLVLTFSEAVKAGSGYIDIRESGSGTLVRRIAITDNTQVSISGNQVTVNPVADLSPYTSYYVVLGSGVILDLANNTFAGISNSAVFNFMTNSAYIDTTAPIVLFTSPAFSGNGNIVVTFNEPVVAGTGMIEIRKATDGSVARTISVTDTAQVSFAGRNVTINPATDLDPGVVHYVVIAPGTITDLDGNDYDGYSSVASFVDASAIATGTGIGTTGYGASAVAVGATITNAGFASVALNAFASASAVALGSGVWASVNATATATGTGTGEWSSGDLIGGNDTALNLAVLSYGAALNGELISISNTSVDILGTDGLTYRIFGSGFNFSAGSVAEIGGSGIWLIEIWAGSGGDAHVVHSHYSEFGSVSSTASFDVSIQLDGDDTIVGSSEDDALVGFDSNDMIFGREGDDTLDGGNGDDLISGGLGSDSLAGGAGVDTFKFVSGVHLDGDAVNGLENSDKIDLSEIPGGRLHRQQRILGRGRPSALRLGRG